LFFFVPSLLLKIGTPSEIRGRETESGTVLIGVSNEFGKFALRLTGRAGESLTTISPKPVSASNGNRLR